MTNYEKVLKMFEMQVELDKSIYEAKGKTYSPAKMDFAIIDEIGELTHELKPLWCWWKDTVGEIDRTKVLQELVDIWHFVMSHEIHMAKLYNDSIDEHIQELSNRINSECEIKDGYDNTRYYLADVQYDLINIAEGVNKLKHLVELTKTLHFSIEDIFTEYIRKNEINYERLRKGY